MKIALIRPPATYANWYLQPHFSLCCLAAVLDANSIECRIFDAYFNGWSRAQLVGRVVDYGPSVVGLSSMTHEISQAHEIAGYIKGELDATSIIGGPHVTALPERTLIEFPFFDFGIFGEGELSLVELLQCLSSSSSKKDISNIAGLVYRDDGVVRANKQRTPLTTKELDALPFPAYHHYYGNIRSALAGRNAEYRIMAARGCPYRCSFCMQVLGRQLRRRSPENIVAEIEHAISRYSAHNFRFQDELLVADNQYSRKLFGLMITSRISQKIKWSAQTRANLVTDEIIGLAKQAGCFLLGMGVESGDDNTLERIHKGISVDQVREAVRIVKKHHVKLGTYFIIGHPYESRQTAQRTIDLATELNTDTIAVGIMVPYPGTEIYKMAKRGQGGYNLLSEEWSTYDKYGNRALALQNLSSRDLQLLQQKAYLHYYIKNLRLLGLARFLWEKKRAIYFFFMRSLSLIRLKNRTNNQSGSSHLHRDGM